MQSSAIVFMFFSWACGMRDWDIRDEDERVRWSMYLYGPCLLGERKRELGVRT